MSSSIALRRSPKPGARSEEHTSELQSRVELVCRLLLEKKKAIRAGGAHARAILEVNCLLQFLVGIVAHLVASDAERLGVRDIERPVESAPDKNSADAP